MAREKQALCQLDFDILLQRVAVYFWPDFSVWMEGGMLIYPTSNAERRAGMGPGWAYRAA